MNYEQLTEAQMTDVTAIARDLDAWYDTLETAQSYDVEIDYESSDYEF